jgi:hypothetical protein
MVVALVALFSSLAGAAGAVIVLGPNSVGSEQIRAGAVGTRELRSHAVTGSKVADGSLTGVDLANRSVPGSKISGGVDRASLANTLDCPAGTVPSVGLCIESGLRAPADFSDAEAICGRANRRLPTLGELLAYRADGGTLANPELTGSGIPALQIVLYANGATTVQELGTTVRSFRCVGLPTG